MKSHERKIILVLCSPRGQNHSLVPSFIHSFTQLSSVEHLPLFIKPRSRGTRVKAILPAPKETYNLVGIQSSSSFLNPAFMSFVTHCFFGLVWPTGNVLPPMWYCFIVQNSDLYTTPDHITIQQKSFQSPQLLLE